MSAAAQYASVPKLGTALISTANTARDGTGTLGVVSVAPAPFGNGRRIDKIVIQALGTTTQGKVRLFITKGRPGVGITSITFVGTTATVTTATAHGMTTGDKVTLHAVFPDDYNVVDIAATVTTATSFTYVMATTPTLNANVMGSYVTTPAVPVSSLWREVNISAITADATTTSPFSTSMATGQAADSGYMPLVLPSGYSLRASTNNAESFNVIAAFSGDFA